VFFFIQRSIHDLGKKLPSVKDAVLCISTVTKPSINSVLTYDSLKFANKTVSTKLDGVCF